MHFPLLINTPDTSDPRKNDLETDLILDERTNEAHRPTRILRHRSRACRPRRLLPLDPAVARRHPLQRDVRGLLSSGRPIWRWAISLTLADAQVEQRGQRSPARPPAGRRCAEPSRRRCDARAALRAARRRAHRRRRALSLPHPPGRGLPAAARGRGRTRRPCRPRRWRRRSTASPAPPRATRCARS